MPQYESWKAAKPPGNWEIKYYKVPPPPPPPPKCTHAGAHSSSPHPAVASIKATQRLGFVSRVSSLPVHHWWLGVASSVPRAGCDAVAAAAAPPQDAFWAECRELTCRVALTAEYVHLQLNTGVSGAQGLGTSTSDETKGYFADLNFHRKIFEWRGMALKPLKRTLVWPTLLEVACTLQAILECGFELRVRSSNMHQTCKHCPASLALRSVGCWMGAVQARGAEIHCRWLSGRSTSRTERRGSQTSCLAPFLTPKPPASPMTILSTRYGAQMVCVLKGHLNL